MGKRNAAEVNAGSMADIAFLLLIFFLVTTTIDKDKGILRQLPKKEEVKDAVDVHKRNIFMINMNSYGDLLINDKVISIEEIKTKAIQFIDNGGDTNPLSIYYCDYCKGDRKSDASDHPDKAIISITVNRDTPYENYIAVQNELNAAYNHLRNRESQRLYGYNFTEIDKAVKDGSFSGDLSKIKAELKIVRSMFKMLITEAETQFRS